MSAPCLKDAEIILVRASSSQLSKYEGRFSIANNSVQFLGAGAYNFTVVRDDTVNYSNTIDEKEFVITKAVPQGSLAGTTPIIYGTAGDVEGTESNILDSDVTL